MRCDSAVLVVLRVEVEDTIRNSVGFERRFGMKGKRYFPSSFQNRIRGFREGKLGTMTT